MDSQTDELFEASQRLSGSLSRARSTNNSIRNAQQHAIRTIEDPDGNGGIGMISTVRVLSGAIDLLESTSLILEEEIITAQKRSKNLHGLSHQ